MTDEQNWAEQLDDEVLSESTTDGERIEDTAAEEDYPPDRPYVVDDQGSVYDLEDDLATRVAREQDDDDEG
ncbi:hypothetical protein [Desertimonas flava]|uniref:hypothetical protein n=1 Tax=Desertimonas flava TaxID=2064846 RepID=UPI0013C3F6F9|nr:hypothetical protein [Desertimonas flava]